MIFSQCIIFLFLFVFLTLYNIIFIVVIIKFTSHYKKSIFNTKTFFFYNNNWGRGWGGSGVVEVFALQI